MRNYLLSYLSLFCCVLTAQNPYFFTSTVSPQPTSQTDFIKIFTKFGTSNTTGKISESFTLNATQKTVDLDLCYWSTQSTSAPSHKDTFAIGMLAPGIYTANLTVQFSNSLNICASYTSGSTSFTFEVLSSIIGITKNELDDNSITLFPNPIDDKLLIDTKGVSIDKLSILSGLGEIVFQTSETIREVNTEFLKSGLYFVKVENKSGLRTFKILKYK
jgi:hypothetical protein